MGQRHFSAVFSHTENQFHFVMNFAARRDFNPVVVALSHAQSAGWLDKVKWFFRDGIAQFFSMGEIVLSDANDLIHNLICSKECAWQQLQTHLSYRNAT